MRRSISLLTSARNLRASATVAARERAGVDCAERTADPAIMEAMARTERHRRMTASLTHHGTLVISHDFLFPHQQAVRPADPFRRHLVPAQPRREGRSRRTEWRRQDDAVSHDRRGG